MNPFVNPKKRSISLPAGCRDLADVLKPRRRRIAKLDMPVTWGQMPAIKPVRYERAGLIHVLEHVAEIISARMVEASLHIRTLDGLRGVSLYRSGGGELIPLPDTGERTRRIEEFFMRRGIKADFDQPIGGSEATGGIIRILTFPLPLDASVAGGLTTELLRAVYDVDDEAGLEFTAVNIKTA